MTKRKTVTQQPDNDLEECIRFLTSDWEHQGGYPGDYDYTTIPGYLVTATLDHKGAPELSIYDMGHIREWVERSRQMVTENKYETLYDALIEENGPFTV